MFVIEPGVDPSIITSMKTGNLCRFLIACLTGIAMLASCGGKKEKAAQELETSGYEATPADFLRAAENGDVRVLELFAEQGMDLNTKDGNGWTALHLAARTGRQESAAFLLESGMGIDTPGLDGVTPLILAAREGQHTMVRYLLRQGAKAELRDSKKRTALILAVDGNHPACIEELAPYSRSGLDTALLYAASQGRHKTVGTLASFGASVYARHTGGMTPLMLAAQNGHTDTVAALLDNGANRYAVNEHGWTAAQVAAAAGQDAIAQLLDREPDAAELTLTEPDNGESVEWTPPPLASDLPQNTAAEPDTTDPPAPAPGTPSPTLTRKGSSKGVALPAAAPVNLPFISGKTIETPASDPGTVSQNLHMVDYQQRNLPLIVDKTQPSTAGGSEAVVRTLYGKQNKTVVREGDTIPNTHFRVTRIRRMLNHSKITDGQPADVSTVEIEDTRTGQRRTMTARVPATATEPWAVLRNRSSRKNYAARPGQSFTTSHGTRYTITDVRPNQIILTQNETGETVTIPLGK